MCVNKNTNCRNKNKEGNDAISNHYNDLIFTINDFFAEFYLLSQFINKTVDNNYMTFKILRQDVQQHLFL